MRSDVIPLAIERKVLDLLRNHLELDIIEALFLELDHGSKTRTHLNLVPNPKLIGRTNFSQIEPNKRGETS